MDITLDGSVINTQPWVVMAKYGVLIYLFVIFISFSLDYSSSLS